MSGPGKKRGKLVIISGPSGVGKSTICKALAKRTGAHLSVSATPREISDKEVDGREYWFLPREDFLSRVEEGDFLEYAEVFGNFYGTPRSKVEEALEEGKTVILEIDIQGGEKARKIYKDAETIFILPPSESDLSERMQGRGRGEDSHAAKRRLEGAESEILSAKESYKHMIVNDNLEEAIKEITGIMKTKTGEKE